MEPITTAIAIGAGAQVLSSVAQYYQAEKARKASEKKLNEIAALFDAIKPPEYDVSPLDPPEYIQTAIPEPAFDMSRLSPEMYAIAAKYVPEVASYVAEQNPTLVQYSATGAAGREAQIQALKDIKSRTGELADAEAESASGQAMRDAQIAAQSRQQSILQDANRRGQLGSGAMLAAQLQGSSDAMGRAAGASNDAYLEALRNKMGALRESGTMGRQLAQDDLSLSQTNAGIINSFNQRAAANMNNYLQGAADTRNRGQLYNVQTAQDVSNKNVGLSNEYNRLNQQRQDALMEYLDKRRLGERDYQNQIAAQQYQARAGEKQRQANLKTQIFENEMERARGKAGLGSAQVSNMMQSAADRNQAYQGMSNFIGNAAMNYQGRQDQAAAQQASDARFQQQMDYQRERDEQDRLARQKYGSY